MAIYNMAVSPYYFSYTTRLSMFDAAAVRTTTTSTRLVYTNPDGSIVEVIGAGFTFGSGGVATAGVVSELRFGLRGLDPVVGDLLAEITGTAAPLPALLGAWFGGGDRRAESVLLSGNDTVNNLQGRQAPVVGYAGDDVLKAVASSGFPIRGYDARVSYALDAAQGGIAGVFVNLVAGRARDGFGGTDTLIGIINVTGTNRPGPDIPGASDVLLGNASGNWFQGLGGADYLDGGAGEDTVDYSLDAENGGTRAVYVNLAERFGRDAFGNYDVVLNFEHIRGTNGLTDGTTGLGDVLFGDAGDNTLVGLGGLDVLDGKAGIDTVSYAEDAAFGGARGVLVDLAAGIGVDGFGDWDTLVSIENIIGSGGAQPGLPGFSDILLGSAAGNVLSGGDGNDVLDGREGNDRLEGGSGSDTLTGGLGGDVFVFDTANSFQDRDVVTDFDPTQDLVAVPLYMLTGYVLPFAPEAGPRFTVTTTDRGVTLQDRTYSPGRKGSFGLAVHSLELLGSFTGEEIQARLVAI